MKNARRRWFALTVTLFVTAFAAAAVPTSLYDVQQRQWGFSSFLLTVAFAAYACGLLLTLLTAGRIADHWGRRRVVVAGLVMNAVAVLVLLTAGSISVMIAGRAIQGVAMGLLMGALGAAVIAAAPAASAGRTGPIITSSGAQFGSAAGGLIGGAAVAWSEFPAPVLYGPLSLVFIVGALLCIRLPPGPTAPGALRSLRPRIRVPRESRRAFRAVSPVFAGGWMFGALYLSLGPTILRDFFDQPGIGGVVLAVYGVVAATSGAVGAAIADRAGVVAGSLALILGTTCFALSAALLSLPLLVVATTVAACGFGLANAGAFRLVIASSGEEGRAGLLSASYIVTYCAYGAPVVLAGLAIDAFGVRATTVGYALVTALVGALGLVSTLRWSSPVPPCGAGATEASTRAMESGTRPSSASAAPGLPKGFER